jgi:hypothetical protein
MQNDVLAAAKQVQNQVEAPGGLVITNYAGSRSRERCGSYGLAVYFAISSDQYVQDPWADHGKAYEKSNQSYPVEFVKDCEWSDFLHSYWSQLPK